MGLTIHYKLKSKVDDALPLVKQMREIAVDFPFEEVEEIKVLEGDECIAKDADEERRWFLIQAGDWITCPWNKRISREVDALRIVAFSIIPGPGCEVANIGLCQYPSTVSWEYNPEQDAKFQELHHPWGPGSKAYRFSYKKWDRWIRKQGDRWGLPYKYVEERQVPTNLSAWSWSSFCKTQYASESESGGVPNFLRCHISLITLLERIAKIKGVRVSIDDEGQYGRSRYTDDPYAEKRVYTWHPPEHSPAKLIKQIGEWNEMIAAFGGAIRDAAEGSGVSVEAPIFGYQNFEQLEFKGRSQKGVDQFLKSLGTSAPVG